MKVVLSQFNFSSFVANAATDHAKAAFFGVADPAHQASIVQAFDALVLAHNADPAQLEIENEALVIRSFVAYQLIEVKPRVDKSQLE